MFLSQWGTINNAEEKEKVARLKVVKWGVRLSDCGKNDFKTSNSIFDFAE